MVVTVLLYWTLPQAQHHNHSMFGLWFVSYLLFCLQGWRAGVAEELRNVIFLNEGEGRSWNHLWFTHSGQNNMVIYFEACFSHSHYFILTHSKPSYLPSPPRLFPPPLFSPPFLPSFTFPPPSTPDFLIILFFKQGAVESVEFGSSCLHISSSLAPN